jgi:hypothetical protein
MSISWGRKNRFRFNAAGEISTCAPPEGFPAVFAITYKRDEEKRPKSHTVLYFGESADVSVDMLQQCKNVKELYINRGGSDMRLYVFYHGMPRSTYLERVAVQEQLIDEYDPMMNSEN